jgi:hypothetical protein
VLPKANILYALWRSAIQSIEVLPKENILYDFVQVSFTILRMCYPRNILYYLWRSAIQSKDVLPIRKTSSTTFFTSVLTASKGLLSKENDLHDFG